MTSPTIDDGTRPRHWRSIAAVLAGLITIFALSLGVDQLLHELNVYPPWGEPMNETGDNLLALSYRIVIAVFGSWLTARLAPSAPMRHALILGGIGVVLTALGGFAAVSMGMGPAWYPILLALSSIPCAWLGGVLARRPKS
ncbi:MAG: hypothetical protein H0W65_06110 [Sphingomonas sp.]|uniref:hypothetical protein n=1 Tax=Sphingomonas sp. TaxID=28214 RepID=UPI001794408A|nr:hypothetical protein [Sphingomonas sp.]MBA3667279.1 hypothetical protein [Sphingomonas sp.]